MAVLREDGPETSAGLMIVTGQCEDGDGLHTHASVCERETEMAGRCLVGRNVGVCVCDRQEGVSNGMKNPQ